MTNTIKSVLISTIIIVTIGTISTTIPNKEYTPEYLEETYYSMPQLLFEDLCLKYPRMTKRDMALYYLNNKTQLDKIYPQE